MTGKMLVVDHLIWACRDIDHGIAVIAELTGVAPAKGGRHHGNGTQNALLSLGETLYLEVLAPDFDQELAGTPGQRLAHLAQPGMLTFCMAQPDLAAQAELLTKAGLTADGPLDYARETPSGETMRWQLLFAGGHGFGDHMPFFIDWMACRHPARTAPGGCTLTEFSIGHPEAGALNALYRSIGIPCAAAQTAQPELTATLQTPKGPACLTTALPGR